MPNVAVVVGGAESVWAEVELAKALCKEANRTPEFFIINDMIAVFPGEARAITLHPAKLQQWLDQRRNTKYPEPTQVWCHSLNRLVTNHTLDWGGSSGLFSIKIAREEDFKKILLCGVPMTVQDNHFVRHQRWNACTAFQEPWKVHLHEIKPYVRSFSGWTAEQLGKPTVEFLAEYVVAAT